MYWRLACVSSTPLGTPVEPDVDQQGDVVGDRLGGRLPCRIGVDVKIVDGQCGPCEFGLGTVDDDESRVAVIDLTLGLGEEERGVDRRRGGAQAPGGHHRDEELDAVGQPRCDD